MVYGVWGLGFTVYKFQFHDSRRLLASERASVFTAVGLPDFQGPTKCRAFLEFRLMTTLRVQL